MTNLIDADFFATKTGSPSRPPSGEPGDDASKVEFAKLLSAPDGDVPDEVALLQGELGVSNTPNLPAGTPTVALPDIPSEEIAIADPALTNSQAPDITVPETAIVVGEAPTVAVDGEPIPEPKTASVPDPRQIDPVKAEPEPTAKLVDDPKPNDQTNTKAAIIEPETIKKGDAAPETKVAAGTPDTPGPAAVSVDKASTVPANTPRTAVTETAEPTLSQSETQIRAATTGSATTAVEAPSTPAIQTATSSAAVTASAVTPTAPAAATPTPPTVTAAPAEIPSIVAQSLSSVDDHKDRILVQLDPPELGRISIDFKFDAAGLQHVTITGETPEALRQLRQMHFELLQALERQGLSSQDMTFRQNNPGDNPNAELFASDASGESSLADALDPIEPVVQRPSPITSLAGGTGLDIRV